MRGTYERDGMTRSLKCVQCKGSQNHCTLHMPSKKKSPLKKRFSSSILSVYVMECIEAFFSLRSSYFILLQKQTNYTAHVRIVVSDMRDRRRRIRKSYKNRTDEKREKKKVMMKIKRRVCCSSSVSLV